MVEPHVAFAARASRRKAEETDWKVCEEELQIALALRISQPEPQPQPQPQPIPTLRKTNESQMQREVPIKTEVFINNMPKIPVDDECRVCYDGVSDHCLVPCGHTGLCQSCALRMNHCPFCKEEIIHAQKMWKV